MTTRVDVYTSARALIGTKYQHQGRLPGVALDCIGVPIVVAWDLGLVPRTFNVTGYPRVPDGQMLMQYSDQYMVRRAADAPLVAGVVIAAAIEQDPQHFGILAPYRHGGLSIIHALADAHPPRVVETRFMPSARLRVVASFDLPGVVA